MADGCTGQLYMESDLGGHVADAVCLHCHRTSFVIPTLDLVKRHHMSWRDVERITRHSVPFLWFVVDDAYGDMIDYATVYERLHDTR